MSLLVRVRVRVKMRVMILALRQLSQDQRQLPLVRSLYSVIVILEKTFMDPVGSNLTDEGIGTFSDLN